MPSQTAATACSHIVAAFQADGLHLCVSLAASVIASWHLICQYRIPPDARLPTRKEPPTGIAMEADATNGKRKPPSINPSATPMCDNRHHSVSETMAPP